MRIALGVHRPGEVRDQNLDSHADDPGAFLRAVPAAPGVRPQEIGNRFQFALRLGPHRLNLQPVIDHRLQLALPPAHGPNALSPVQPEAAQLNRLLSPGGLVAEGPGVQGQGHRVNGLRWRMQQQPSDIQSAWLVWEDRVLALKSDFPKPRTPAQGMRALVLEIAVGGLSARAHNHSFFWFFA